MKKIVLLLAIGMLLVAGAAFGQTAQGANTTGSAQGNSSDNFGRGGYTGPVLGIITIDALRDSEPNAFVIVEGYLIQQRVPGTYILANAARNHTVSVVVHINPYFWSNLQIDANTPILVYGTVNRSELRIELEATRVEIKR
jgi:uncharacterized protein YdeI (BOF family)